MHVIHLIILRAEISSCCHCKSACAETQQLDSQFTEIITKLPNLSAKEIKCKWIYIALNYDSTLRNFDDRKINFCTGYQQTISYYCKHATRQDEAADLSLADILRCPLLKTFIWKNSSLFCCCEAPEFFHKLIRVAQYFVIGWVNNWHFKMN